MSRILTLRAGLGEHLGVHRVVDPVGALPQQADVLDATSPRASSEFEIEVDRLCLDATSFRNIRAAAGADPLRMAARIEQVVATRGKMHNPETDSGGVALGRVLTVGSDVTDPPPLGARIVTLASLTLTPLRLEEVVRVDPDSALVEVRGTAYVCDSAPWGLVPDDMPVSQAIEIYDVYGAATHTARLAPESGTVYVLGCGHAGKLAMAAAREKVGDGTVVAIDIDPAAVDRVLDAGLCDVGIVADLQDPVGAMAEVAKHPGLAPADLTVVVVDAPRCETFAILATRERGTVLFFSMATSFSTAALTADGMAHDLTMLVGSGFTPDVGQFALDLVRRTPGLQKAWAYA